MKTTRILSVLLLAALFASCESVDTAGSGDSSGSSDLPAPSDVVLKIRAVVTTNDDGSQVSTITHQQIHDWIHNANAILRRSSARIHLTWNPDQDLDLVRNTVLNHLSSSGWGWDEANAYADLYPHRVVIFFRYGTHGDEGDTWGPTGNGFSFDWVRFIALPGIFEDTIVYNHLLPSGWWSEVQNYSQLAHDFGHYLGLHHTFPGNNDDDTATPAKALAYLQSHGGTASAFDGDGLADTAPEVGTSFYINQKWDPCTGHDSYDIGGITFTPDRLNVMSYFLCGDMHFTGDQVNAMWEMLSTNPKRQALLAE